MQYKYNQGFKSSYQLITIRLFFQTWNKKLIIKAGRFQNKLWKDVLLSMKHYINFMRFLLTSSITIYDFFIYLYYRWYSLVFRIILVHASIYTPDPNYQKSKDNIHGKIIIRYIFIIYLMEKTHEFSKICFIYFENVFINSYIVIFPKKDIPDLLNISSN